MFRRLALLVPAYLTVFALCYALAFELRFEFAIPPEYRAVLVRTLPVVVGLQLAVFLVAGDWRRSFRYVTLADVVSFGGAAGIAAAVLYVGNLVVPQSQPIPRSIVFVDAMLLVLTLGGVRGGLRFLNESLRPMVGRGEAERAVIFGTRSNAIGILRTLGASEPSLRIVAFVERRTKNRNAIIAGVPVYSLADADWPKLVGRLAIRHVLVPGSVPGREVREIVNTCAALHVGVHVIPEVQEIVDGRYKLGLRDVTINDLLRREPNELDRDGIRACLGGRRVLVTGAAGSIGSELCRQILDLQPARLVFLDQSELGTFEIENEIRDRGTGGVETEFVVADVLERDALNRTFREHRPEIVFHAAAYKHVPLMERNPREAIRNNVLGTRNVVELADAHGVERFVLISTDKAVRPANVMGASKLVAEKLVQAAGSRSKTRFMTVRFGNVLNSSGSVVPIFRRQIEAGGPVTVTHPQMTRYFLTIPEAVQLVLQAAAIGESGDVLVLEMGDPVRIVDLAKDMILLSGHRYPDDVDIVFTGTRPGEKLTEELFYDAEASTLKVHDKIVKVQTPAVPQDVLQSLLERLERATRDDPERAAEALWNAVAECTEHSLGSGDGWKAAA